MQFTLILSCVGLLCLILIIIALSLIIRIHLSFQGLIHTFSIMHLIQLKVCAEKRKEERECVGENVHTSTLTSLFDHDLVLKRAMECILCKHNNYALKLM